MSVNAFKGDFLGFSFNGIHSSDLNIVRINTGSRADMPLSPNFKDSTVEIPGANGIYYFDTQIQQFPFTINFAYDNINEEKIIKIREKTIACLSPFCFQRIINKHAVRARVEGNKNPRKVAAIIKKNPARK